MSNFDSLPKRTRNHETESKAEAAFTSFLADLDDCHLQSTDRKDYGTDCMVEVTHKGMATNVRLHVQLKGTEQALNADGSVSVSIDRANFNYLAMQPFSSFVCYHVPTETLWIRSSDSLVRQYEHSGRNWTEQQNLTVNFSERLTSERFRKLTEGARTHAVSSRDRRISQATVPHELLPAILQQSTPELHVGDNAEQAAAMLQSLYESGADQAISAAFAKFEALLGLDHEAMGFCYMAEINLGMAGMPIKEERLDAAIAHFRSKIGTGRYLQASLLYTIGNALAALGKEKDAAVEYEAALADLNPDNDVELAAQCHKNLGTSLEKLGDEEAAASHFLESLRLSPDLAEAHHALACYYHRKGDYTQALDHFDKVVFLNDSLGKQAAVRGWRLNALFQLDQGTSAFRDITALLHDADRHPWIWPWCARQVAMFGRTSTENAKQAVTFWERFLRAHPGHVQAIREQILAKLYLRSSGEDPNSNFEELKAEISAHAADMEIDAAALIWDRLGHWAQDEGNWTEAEACFRKAYDLEGGHYGYCLGTALNFLGRCDESLPLLKAQAETLQPDAMSWFQVAVAYENLGQAAEAVDAYRKAIDLDPDYDLAWFNLGGVLWNSGEQKEASTVWKQAVLKFPDHDLAAKLRNEIPFILR